MENISHDRHAAVTRYLERFKILIRTNTIHVIILEFFLNTLGRTTDYAKNKNAYFNRMLQSYLLIALLDVGSPCRRYQSSMLSILSLQKVIKFILILRFIIDIAVNLDSRFFCIENVTISAM